MRSDQKCTFASLTVIQLLSWAESWQVIGQTELIPVLVAMRTWEAQLRGRDVVAFLDNSSAVQCLVKRRFQPTAIGEDS